MNKYKILAYLNIFLGIIFSSFPLFVAVFAYPEFIEMYSAFGIENELSVVAQYFPLITIILSLLFLLPLSYVSYKLLSKRTVDKDKFFTYGIYVLISSFLFIGLAVIIMVFSIIFPIYRLTSEF